MSRAAAGSRRMGTPGALLAAVCGTAVVASPRAASAQTMTPATTSPARMDEDPVTPRMMALGGRAEAVSASTSSLFANPSAITGTRAYHVDAYGLYDPSINRFSFGSAIVDSTRSFVAAGLSYIYNNVTDPADSRGTRTGHDVRLNLALPITQYFGIGATARYLNITAGPLNINPQSTLSSDAWAGFTFDAGLFLKPVQFIQLSATGRNLNNPNTTAAPIGTGFGLAIIPAPILTLVADCLLDYRLNDGVRGRYSGGAELFIADHYAIRAGYAYDDIRGAAQMITAGLGYLDSHFGVELAGRQEFLPVMQTTLMLSVRYFYQPQQ